ncbi:hypothetical protein GGR51DRAFT_559688 [Nemania sp. FL0031]|nr:hypothetical protein GGR51DRAFT_559688 [Nemania sp. FL0031]
MASNKEVGNEPDNIPFDESLLDPQLKTESDAMETRLEGAPTVASGSLREELCDRLREDYDEAKLPQTAYTSLDFCMASLGVQNEYERNWLIGLQAGIGLGIDGAREAILNEMQWENTVFNRPLQQSPSDPDPHQIRMEIGESCATGFDRRVAFRTANHFLGTCSQLADIVVQHGLTACLPGSGNPLMGTSMFYSAEDVARCYENSPLIYETPEVAVAEPQVNTGMNYDVGVEQPASLTASFMGGGSSIAGIDMARLDGASALVANAVKATYGIDDPIQDGHLSTHAENNGDSQTGHEDAGKGEKVADHKPKADRRA